MFRRAEEADVIMNELDNMLRNLKTPVVEDVAEPLNMAGHLTRTIKYLSNAF